MAASPTPALLYRSRLPVPSPRLRRCSDDQLVDRFRDGRDEAFRVIHDRYRARLLGYVGHMLSGRSREDVEDVVQDVFERAARTLRAEAAPGGLPAWLYSVAHNRCVDELRRRPPAPPDLMAAGQQPAADTSAVAERRADVERLVSDLRRLPELQRSALLMREFQGLSHAELARVLDTSVPAVKSLIVRARIGLLDARDARLLPCAAVREDLAAAHDRRVKTSAKAARHLRECTACRSYRTELRRTSRRLAALIPAPTLFPLGLLGRLLGGSGAQAEAPAAGSVIAGSSGAAMAGAGKLAALLSGAAAVATGAILVPGGDRPAAPVASSSSPAAGLHAAAPARRSGRGSISVRSHPAAGTGPVPLAAGPSPPTVVSGAPPAAGARPVASAGAGAPVGGAAGPGTSRPAPAAQIGGGQPAGAEAPGPAAALPTTTAAEGIASVGAAAGSATVSAGSIGAAAGGTASRVTDPAGSLASSAPGTVSQTVAGVGIGAGLAAAAQTAGQALPVASGLTGPGR